MNTTSTEVAAAAGREARGEFDVWRIREDFPVLRQTVHGKPLVYLDNAATTQKPRAVIAAIDRFYTADCSNVHRGVHLLSERATMAYEEARGKVRRFLNAASEREIIFVRGTTEAINLVAHSFGRPRLGPGDEVVLTHMEHHSNIVPWQLLCEEKGARLRVAPIDDRGELIFEEFERLLRPCTRIVAVAHVSNALGTVNPLRRIIEAAHARGIPVLVDGAQAAAHIRLDVQDLDCDFYAFSGHKLYGPSGIGVLYGKASWLEQMPPYQSGGDMIRTVSFEKTTFNELPYKFEAGTPNIAGAIGLGAAIDYLDSIGLEQAAAWEQELLAYATERVGAVPGVRLIGTAREKGAVLSFVMEGVHPHDIATVLDRQGVAVRAGHVCAQPVMERFGVPAIARASFAFYNTREEVDVLVTGLQKVREIFG
ncbi:MAG: cysteine desulfurase [Bryobacterales bacterium]|nr:cysteine desulfurase [Bryobacteraceae bacterium]MDW8354209.1 cysteine desulfurase [Bryobacterales bacterium]